jgi:hypothetical protein
LHFSKAGFHWGLAAYLGGGCARSTWSPDGLIVPSIQRVLWILFQGNAYWSGRVKERPLNLSWRTSMLLRGERCVLKIVGEEWGQGVTLIYRLVDVVIGSYSLLGSCWCVIYNRPRYWTSPSLTAKLPMVLPRTSTQALRKRRKLWTSRSWRLYSQFQEMTVSPKSLQPDWELLVAVKSS